MHIFEAVKTDNITAIKECLSKGTDVNYKDVRGCTPLHVACRCNSVNAVEFLLSHGADTEVRKKHGPGVNSEGILMVQVRYMKQHM